MTNSSNGLERGSGRERGARIASIARNSAAERAGLLEGDELISINGRLLRDVLDYQFYASDDLLTLRIQRPDKPEPLDIEVYLGGEPLGLRFAESTFDGIKRCRNRCPFCFVTQLPKNMRKSLYVKDDDYRYSVSYGSFVTLTNLSEEDWQRLVEQHLSPLRISVHTTDLELRRRMLGNPKAPDVLGQLRRMQASGIEAHTQLVLCPGVNDGQFLERSVRDLAELYPTVQSIGVVPVGLSRENRVDGLRLYTEGEAREIVAKVGSLQRDIRKLLGNGLVYLADEFYLLSGVPFPSGRSYDGFPQYENGVGLVRSLLDEWSRLRRKVHQVPLSGIRLTLVCGERIAPVLAPIVDELSGLTPLDPELVAVPNEYFGQTITVSGLLTGGDVAKALKGRDLGELVVLPRTMLNVSGEYFLDDLTPSDLEITLGCPVRFALSLRTLIQTVLDLKVA